MEKKNQMNVIFLSRFLTALVMFYRYITIMTSTIVTAIKLTSVSLLYTSLTESVLK